MEKTVIKIPGWENIEKYLEKENEDSLKWAVVEADKLFLKIVNQKEYKDKKESGRISKAIKEISNPETFVKNREVALGLKNKIDFETGDVFSVEEIVGIYEKAISDILYGKISEEKYKSIKYRFWPYYYYILLNKRKILKTLLWTIFIVAIMLFIADTTIGRDLFEYLISKIHFILRLILAVLLIIFGIAFFVVLFIVILESRGRKRSRINK